MKKSILASVFAFSAICFVQACPVFYLGKVYVVNEQMEILKDVEFWRMHNFVDSTKKLAGNWDNEIEDSFSYHFYTNGRGYRFGYEQEVKPSAYKFRIKAKGYANLVLNDIDFSHCGWEDTSCTYPVLYLIMQTHQFKTSGTRIERIDEYEVEKPIQAIDTLIFKPSIETAKGGGNASFINKIEAFPNPFTNKIELVLSAQPKSAYHFTIYNVAGQKIKEAEVLKQHEQINLDELKNGAYIFSLKDDLGNLIYQNKIIKSVEN